MRPSLLLSVALLALSSASASASELPRVDLDGDGKVDALVLTEEALRIGKEAIACGGFEFPCEVSVVDLRSSDSYKELLVCEYGPREDRDCSLWALRKGKPVAISLKDASGDALYYESLTASGSGILLAAQSQRYWKRLHKYILSSDGLSASPVAQPFYAVAVTVHVDRTFPITMEPGGGSVVANVRPDSDIEILLEHGSQRGMFLVRVSSGLVGWTHEETLARGSDWLQMVLGSG